MEKKVKHFILKNSIDINNTVICGVSGGVDSLVMLNILYKLGYKVVLAHVNHNKRPESIIEQAAMEEYAKQLGIPFELLSYHYDGNDNFHNAAHNARYKFFKDLCDKYNTCYISTAHHMEDQVETILIKIMEGSNLYGYGGISISANDGKYKLVRPLLCVDKKEIYSYGKNNNIKYFEDSSNSEDDYLRNRLRHNVVPLLLNECSDLYDKFLQYSIQAKEAFDYIRKHSIEYLKKTNNKIELNTFNSLDIAVKKDIISLLFEMHNIRKNNNLINDIIIFLKNNNGEKKLDLENNYILIREYNKAYIMSNITKDIQPVYIGINDIGIFNEKYKFYFSKSRPINNAKYIKLCYNTLELPFVIRPRLNGDSIELQIGNKKINRVFIDYKISKNQRDSVPIICDNKGKILWVYDLVKSKDVYDQKKDGEIYLVCEVLTC